MQEQMKNIEFTKEQFETLIKLVYMGEWLVNAHRLSNDHVHKFTDLEKHILSHASNYGLEKFTDTYSGKIYHTGKLESDPEINKYIKEFANETFWDELCDRLSEREDRKSTRLNSSH